MAIFFHAQLEEKLFKSYHYLTRRNLAAVVTASLCLCIYCTIGFTCRATGQFYKNTKKLSIPDKTALFVQRAGIWNTLNHLKQNFVLIINKFSVWAPLRTRMILSSSPRLHLQGCCFQEKDQSRTKFHVDIMDIQHLLHVLPILVTFTHPKNSRKQQIYVDAIFLHYLRKVHKKS